MELTDKEKQSIHIVMRAFHDGICPSCGKFDKHELGEGYHCLNCEYIISAQEMELIQSQVGQVLKGRLADFKSVREKIYEAQISQED